MIKDNFTIEPTTGQNNGKINVSCEANKDTNMKHTSIMVSGGGINKTINITQLVAEIGGIEFSMNENPYVGDINGQLTVFFTEAAHDFPPNRLDVIGLDVETNRPIINTFITNFNSPIQFNGIYKLMLRYHCIEPKVRCGIELAFKQLPQQMRYLNQYFMKNMEAIKINGSMDTSGFEHKQMFYLGLCQLTNDAVQGLEVEFPRQILIIDPAISGLATSLESMSIPDKLIIKVNR